MLIFELPVVLSLAFGVVVVFVALVVVVVVSSSALAAELPYKESMHVCEIFDCMWVESA